MRTNHTVSAEQHAVALRRELAIPASAAIEFAFIFDTLNIHFRRALLEGSILGASKVEGLNKLIVVSSEIKYLAQERFTIAHELGHVILHHGYSYCKYVDIFEPRTKAGKESEANIFASAFLLPPTVIKELAASGDITINMAGKIARQYGVSLTATIIALVKASPLFVCAFIQSNGRIEHSVCSAECIATPRIGSVSPKAGIHAVSYDNCERNSNCDYTCWFNEKPDANFVCNEETKFFSKLNSAVSIVHIWEDF